MYLFVSDRVGVKKKNLKNNCWMIYMIFFFHVTVFSLNKLLLTAIIMG